MMMHVLVKFICLLAFFANVETTSPAPTFKPSKAPTVMPTQKPTSAPSSKNPTTEPTLPPAPPTITPTSKPSVPTVRPSRSPTRPTRIPTSKPTIIPTAFPTNPTAAPTDSPTRLSPTPRPSAPTMIPSAYPTNSQAPTPAPSLQPTLSPTTLAPGEVIVSFPFTGSVQVFTVPADVTEITVTLVGASGGNMEYYGVLQGGGRGALITAKVPVNPGDVFHIYVGGMGGRKAGGYNGGGSTDSAQNACAAGGGATDLRIYPFTIDERVLVAGGGGGAAGICVVNSGGHGGWPSGSNSAYCTNYYPAKGGTQQSGGAYSDASPTQAMFMYGTAANQGSFFYGGNGITRPSGEGFGGGGGGGYYGGGGSYGSGGGGGSSYSNYPIVQALNGTWTGNGTAWIRYVVPGNEDPTMAPTLAPTQALSIAATGAPSVTPSLAPTLVPSAHPSNIPTLTPSVTSTFEPTRIPTFTVTAPNPTSPPTLQPSELPSLIPSGLPTLQPSAGPTYTVTAPIPTASPSLNPSTLPSAVPTVLPSGLPSVAPSAATTIAPTTGPTLSPTKAPTMSPTVLPTVLSVAPTLVPTQVPSARPTLKTEDPYKVELGVEQVVYGINNCTTQLLPCNRTIQHTVADIVPGVIPERVTDIIIEEEEEEGRLGRSHVLASSPSFVTLKYKVTVYDPVLSAEVLTAQLKAQVSIKQMDSVFNKFAHQFGVHGLQNATFTALKVTYLNPAGDFEDPPSNGEIAGLVIGGFVFLLLLTLGVWVFTRYLRLSEENRPKGKKDQSKAAVLVVAV